VAIPSRQIGWNEQQNLLWNISKQLEQLVSVWSKVKKSVPNTTTTTSSTTVVPITTTTTTIPATTTTTTTAAIVGNTYYVSTTGINSSNRGAEALPLLTIQYALNNYATYGDTVIVEDGIYNAVNAENIIIWNTGGTLANPIVIKSRNKWGAVLSGNNNLSGICFGTTTGTSGIVIQDFEITGFSDDAIKLSNANNIKIKGNKIHGIGKYCTDTDQGITAVYLSTASNIIIENNLIYDIGRYATGENGCTNTTISWMNKDHGLYLAQALVDVTIANNIIYDCKAGWCVSAGYDLGGNHTRVKVINNTFSGFNPNRMGQVVMTVINLIDCLYANNIFYNTSVAGFRLDTQYLTASGTVFSNNIISNGITCQETEAGITMINNFENTNPLMTNPAGLDFTLTSTSPAINAGAIVGLTTDYLGNPIVGIPDIGAYEYIA
jgi:hypothetical protein